MSYERNYDADIEDLKQRVSRGSGLTRDRLDKVLEAMVETMTLFRRYQLFDEQEKADGWNNYLGGSYEVLRMAGAHSYEVEQLVSMLYDKQERERKARNDAR